jgi:hypothetical protein
MYLVRHVLQFINHDRVPDLFALDQFTQHCGLKSRALQKVHRKLRYGQCELIFTL